MMAPRNAYPACPRAPREIHISDSAAYFTGEGQNDRTGACPVGSGNPTGVNSFSACLLAKNDRIGRARLDLVNQGHVNPLGLEVHRESGGFTLWNAKHIPPGLAPWNFGSACLGGRNARITVECLNLVRQGVVIPLGLGGSLSRYPIKLHQLTTRMGLFYFAPWNFVIAPGRRIFNRGRDYWTIPI